LGVLRFGGVNTILYKGVLTGVLFIFILSGKNSLGKSGSLKLTMSGN
jgi:hypothetical protein